MHTRGIRGATTINNDNPAEILSATKELLMAILKEQSNIGPEDMASAIFTVTEDIVSVFLPKQPERLDGISPIDVYAGDSCPGSLPLCIRVLIHWNTDLSQSEFNISISGASEGCAQI